MTPTPAEAGDPSAAGTADDATDVSAGLGWRADLADVVPAWIVARVLVGLAALLALAIASGDRPDGTTSWLTEGLLAWDGQWYDRIATQGYEGMEVALGTDEGLRFFPGHPLLARLLGLLPFLDAAGGLVVGANVAALGVGVLARRITLAEGHGPAAARRVVWVVTLLPPAFVLVWGYSEALFMVAAMGALLAARRRWWWLAALGGLLAGVTRPLGLLLAIPLAWEAWEAWRGRPGLAPHPVDPTEHQSAVHGGARWRALLRATGRAPRVGSLVAVASPVAGTALYLGWVWRVVGDPMLPFTVQTPLRGESVDPLTRLVRGIGDLFGAERFGDGLHLPFAVALVVLAVLTFRHWPRSYGILAVVFLLTILSTDNLNSLERYGLGAFPLALTLGVAATGWWAKRITLAVCAAGLVSLTTLAWLGVYVP